MCTGTVNCLLECYNFVGNFLGVFFSLTNSMFMKITQSTGKKFELYLENARSPSQARSSVSAQVPVVRVWNDSVCGRRRLAHGGGIPWGSGLHDVYMQHFKLAQCQQKKRCTPCGTLCILAILCILMMRWMHRSFFFGSVYQQAVFFGIL